MSDARADVRPPNECRARDVLDRVGDKWSLYVIAFLGAGPARFSELRRGIEGISQRMLTVTLRGLERDGVVVRTIHQVMPPHVEYALSPMGGTLLAATQTLIRWSEQHLAEIDAAREAYDTQSRAG